MPSAYVLIENRVGKVAHVAQALRDLDGVQVAEDITGPYDIIAKIQAPSLDQLGRLVVSRALLHLARRCGWRVAKWSHFPSRRLPEVLKAVNLWHRRWRSGTLVEDAGLSDRQMQQCRLAP